LVDLDLLARHFRFLAFVGVGLFVADQFAGQRLGQHRAVIGMIALAEPQAGDAMPARFVRFSRRFAQQTLREMLRKLQLADARPAMQQQRVRPVRSKLLETGPVIGLPRIDHEKSFGSGVYDAILRVLIYFKNAEKLELIQIVRSITSSNNGSSQSVSQLIAGTLKVICNIYKNKQIKYLQPLPQVSSEYLPQISSRRSRQTVPAIPPPDADTQLAYG
jgi:hypothetical protein